MKKATGKKGRKVSFQIKAAAGSTVFMAGTFNNWDPTQHPLSDTPESGVYTTALLLPPGKHEYKFVVNGEWHPDPNCQERVPDGHGSYNSAITV